MYKRFRLTNSCYCFVGFYHLIARVRGTVFNGANLIELSFLLKGILFALLVRRTFSYRGREKQILAPESGGRCAELVEVSPRCHGDASTHMRPPCASTIARAR